MTTKETPTFRFSWKRQARKISKATTRMNRRMNPNFTWGRIGIERDSSKSWSKTACHNEKAALPEVVPKLGIYWIVYSFMLLFLNPSLLRSTETWPRQTRTYCKEKVDRASLPLKCSLRHVRKICWRAQIVCTGKKNNPYFKPSSAGYPDFFTTALVILGLLPSLRWRATEWVPCG